VVIRSWLWLIKDNTFKTVFPRLLEALDLFLRVEYDCIVFFLLQYEIVPVLIPLSLYYCISVKTGVVQIQKLLWNLWCFAKGGVCSWRVQDHLFGVCCVINVFDCLVNSQRFMSTGCSSWLRVNQYKFFLLISLSLLSFKFVFAMFLTLLIKTTDLAKTTNWFSRFTLKTVLKLA